MKCKYCGKDLEGEGVSVYIHGELTASYCSANCMGAAFNKMKQLIKKLNKKELELLVESNTKSGKEKKK